MQEDFDRNISLQGDGIDESFLCPSRRIARGACGHDDELDRRAIGRRFGKNVELATLPMRLRCRPPCGNRVGNRLFLRKLGR